MIVYFLDGAPNALERLKVRYLTFREPKCWDRFAVLNLYIIFTQFYITMFDLKSVAKIVLNDFIIV
jgi:hypothetical protein